MVLRKNVYIIGAGFSKGLGYPLTMDLLTTAWKRLDANGKDALKKVIKFHYPNFSPTDKDSFPNIEQLLTKMKVNQDMFEMSRPAEGGFTKESLLKVQETLLYSIAEWFHELYAEVPDTAWLTDFIKRLKKEKAVVISFNWDLVLDHRLFTDISANSYGLKGVPDSAVLLKPHGSLNWYDVKKIHKVKAEKRIKIFGKKQDNADGIAAFSLARGISSSHGNQYMPLIVAPSYLKDFNRPIFKSLWQKCTDALSTANTIYFLGYSLPQDDMQAQFILRCGFYNQLHGRIKKSGGRHIATGASRVIVVNPDKEAFDRIDAITGPKVECTWIPKRINEWVSSLK